MEKGKGWAAAAGVGGEAAAPRRGSWARRRAALRAAQPLLPAPRLVSGAGAAARVRRRRAAAATAAQLACGSSPGRRPRSNRCSKCLGCVYSRQTPLRAPTAHSWPSLLPVSRTGPRGNRRLLAMIARYYEKRRGAAGLLCLRAAALASACTGGECGQLGLGC